MRIFLTGASGFIGSAIVPELLAAGHEVLGLARSDESAALVESLGAKVIRGDINDLDSLRKGAAQSDGVIHCAFIHDMNNYEESCKTDRLATETMCKELEGSNRAFVMTSGTLMLRKGELVTEESPVETEGASSWRAASEKVAISYVSRGVRSAVIRLPQSVHGEGEHGFVPALIGIARNTGVSAYIGDGNNRWPAVHRLDAAVLYRLAVEKAPPGSYLHATADEGVPTREIASLISRRLNVALVSKTIEEAPAHFTWMSLFYAWDNPTSSAATRKLLDWEPKQLSLLEDIDNDYYFNSY
ncbi:SDR family oxidoreductase [Lipomyces tetrasporus]|uniref:SDR family oxidoreductase n=1 Tax=Lipomyces tetrasporus TaxID=54092 RepID=A0AAD7QYE1_9ASCO|nr:SDR family oxidoreductase [Lipomyces tetrasporus]KAJ8103636.1 SDR family oxidoreductase [Lipomyces tetrasporus]